MKSAKVVINILIVLFLGLGIYFKITDTIAKGTYFSRYGDAHKSSIYWYSLFFFAFVFFCFRLLMNKVDKDQRP